MRRLPFFFLLLLCVLVSCKPSIPDDVIGEEKIEDILYDYHLAMGIAESEGGNADYNRYIRVRQVFDKYGITEEEFDSSMVYWCAHSEQLSPILNRVVARIDAKAVSMGVSDDSPAQNQYSNLNADGDTANIWNSTPSSVIYNTDNHNIYRFKLDADSTTLSGDTYLWAFSTTLFSKSSYKDFYVQLIVEYTNDSVWGTTHTLYREGLVEVRNPVDEVRKEWTPRTIHGIVFMPKRDASQFSLLSLNQMALVRYHNHTAEEVADTTNVAGEYADTIIAERDTIEQRRLAPHEVRGDEAKIRTINVVKQSQIKWVKRSSKK